MKRRLKNATQWGRKMMNSLVLFSTGFNLVDLLERVLQDEDPLDLCDLGQGVGGVLSDEVAESLQTELVRVPPHALHPLCPVAPHDVPPSYTHLANVQINKPGTAQVGAISKAQKDSKTKTTFSTTGDNKSSQITEN